MKESSRDLTVSFPKPCDQPWESMAPRGCNRHCEACDTIIHDLEAMTFEEAERLLATGQEACVRARLRPDGAIALKPSATGTTRRLMVAAGAGLALATAACQTLPEADAPRYRLTGKFSDKEQFYRARLISEDGRLWPKRREPGTGRFIFDNLAPGTYTLWTTDNCGGLQEVETITIGTDSRDLGKVAPAFNESCAIVGVMTRR